MSNSLSRRSFVLGCGSAAIGSVGFMRAEKLWASSNKHIPVDGIQDPRLKEIVQAAIDSAIAAGATYADARLSHTEYFAVTWNYPIMSEHMAFGVRVIADGYWGFAASPEWNTVEASRLGKAAVMQAKANAFIRKGETELAPMSNNESGHWAMPVKDDPFKMAFEEISDFWEGLGRFIRDLEYHERSNRFVTFSRVSKAFGSSVGQYTTQVLYKTGGDISLALVDSNQARFGGSFHGISAAGLGFEHLRDQPLRENILKFHEDLMSSLKLPLVELDVGRYDTLFDTRAVADLLSKTIGRPTEVDTALGFEANAGGVGFIDPVDMLGSFKVGSSKLNVVGDRSVEGSVGRVKWDDEGVSPIKVDLVKDGVVANMQCNREGAALIRDHFARTGQVCQSHGCAYAPSALDAPMVHNMDLTISPDSGSNSLDSLRGGMDKGIEIQGPYIDVDFQFVTGSTFGNVFEIRKGKRIGRYDNGSIMFRTPELWSNLISLGGANSVERHGVDSRFQFLSQKGQPPQPSAASVFSVPALFKELTLLRVK